MKILIVGTGAIGGFYAGQLRRAGADVAVLARGDYEKIKHDGINIESIWGDFNFHPRVVYGDAKDIKEKFDFVIVTTKVLPEISWLDLIAPALDSHSSIALIQNGIFIEKAVAEVFPQNHLVSVIAFIASERLASGLIKHDNDGKLTFGEYQNSNPQKTQKLIDLFAKAQVPCFSVNDIQFERWKKLVWNASFNPISVLAGALDTKKILDNPHLKNLVKNVMLEVALLAKAQGYDIPLEFIEKNINDTEARKVPSRSSMLIDFEAGRAMEVEAILGNAVRFAQKNKLQIPHMETLYALIFAM